MHAAGICLGTIQARTHVQLAPACQQSVIKVQHRLRLNMQHVCGHGGNLGNECTDHVAALGHSDSPLTTMLPPAGFTVTILLCVLMAMTTSPMSWNDCNVSELLQRRFLQIEVNVVLTIGFIVFFCISRAVFFFKKNGHL